MKKCSKCSLSFPIESFYNCTKTKDGKQAWCRSCTHREGRRIYRTPKGRYTILKKDAKARGIDFSLTFEEYESVYTDRCGYCLGKVVTATGIDRIDNSKGYEKENIIPACKWCNYAKGTWSPRAFYEKCLDVVNNYPENLKERGEMYTDETVR